MPSGQHQACSGTPSGWRVLGRRANSATMTLLSYWRGSTSWPSIAAMMGTVWFSWLGSASMKLLQAVLLSAPIVTPNQACADHCLA